MPRLQLDWRGLLRAFRPAADQDGRNIQNVTIDAIGVGIASGVGSFLSVFLVRLGASSFLVGLLTSMPAVTGILLAIPIGQFLQTRRQIVPWFSLSRLGVLSCYALTGLVPFLLHRYQPETIILIWAVATVPQNIVSIAFPIVMGAVAGPQRRFFLMSRRWSVLGVTSAVTVALASLVLDKLPFPINYQVIFLGSVVGGLISYRYSSSLVLPDNPSFVQHTQQPHHGHRLAQLVTVARANGLFTRFLIAQFVFRFGILFAQPLFPIYYVRNLGLPDSWIGAINTANGLVLIVAYFMWTQISRRRGERVVLLAATLGLTFYPVLVGITGVPILLVLYSGLAGIFAAGLDLVMFDLSLATCPANEQATYIAVYQSSIFVATLLAPLLAIVVANSVNVPASLLASGGLRALGFVLLLALGVGHLSAERETIEGERRTTKVGV